MKKSKTNQQIFSPQANIKNCIKLCKENLTSCLKAAVAKAINETQVWGQISAVGQIAEHIEAEYLRRFKVISALHDYLNTCTSEPISPDTLNDIKKFIIKLFNGYIQDLAKINNIDQLSNFKKTPAMQKKLNHLKNLMADYLKRKTALLNFLAASSLDMKNKILANLGFEIYTSPLYDSPEMLDFFNTYFSEYCGFLLRKRKETMCITDENNSLVICLQIIKRCLNDIAPPLDANEQEQTEFEAFKNDIIIDLDKRMHLVLAGILLKSSHISDENETFIHQTLNLIFNTTMTQGELQRLNNEIAAYIPVSDLEKIAYQSFKSYLDEYVSYAMTLNSSQPSHLIEKLCQTLLNSNVNTKSNNFFGLYFSDYCPSLFVDVLEPLDVPVTAVDPQAVTTIDREDSKDIKFEDIDTLLENLSFGINDAQSSHTKATEEVTLEQQAPQQAHRNEQKKNKKLRAQANKSACGSIQAQIKVLQEECAILISDLAQTVETSAFLSSQINRDAFLPYLTAFQPYEQHIKETAEKFQKLSFPENAPPKNLAETQKAFENAQEIKLNLELLKNTSQAARDTFYDNLKKEIISKKSSAKEETLNYRVQKDNLVAFINKFVEAVDSEKRKFLEQIAKNTKNKCRDIVGLYNELNEWNPLKNDSDASLVDCLQNLNSVLAQHQKAAESFKNNLIVAQASVEALHEELKIENAVPTSRKSLTQLLATPPQDFIENANALPLPQVFVFSAALAQSSHAKQPQLKHPAAVLEPQPKAENNQARPSL